MENISNARIEKQKIEVAKTKERLVSVQSKLREQERELKVLEDLAIVNWFRTVHGNEDFAAEIKETKTADAVSGAAETEDYIYDTDETE